MTVVANEALEAVPLDTLRFPLWGSRLIEASAGTGKTYTIASLYVRLVLGHGEMPAQRMLTPPDILVVTFTRAATDELRERIRQRLNEAAACFLEEAEGDDFLQRLRDDYPRDRWPACAHLLHLAADWMDDAAVSTIDAWCYRVLREHAFDSASLFDVEMDVEMAQRAAEATQDYWRQFIAPLPVGDFNRVLQAIGSQLTGKDRRASCDALASVLYRKWLRHVPYYDSPATPAEIFAALHKRVDALKAPWRGWIPQLRELLQEADAAGRFNKNKLRSKSWPGWLDELQAWADDPYARLPFEPRSSAWKRLTPDGMADAWKTGNPPEHPAFEAMACLRAEIEACDAEASRLFPHAACWVADRMEALRRQRAMLDFNGLLEQLDAALRGPNGDRLAQTLRSQFPVALIDEFQDTNPVQYCIFDRIYNVESNDPSSLLALIGDPKQAIYRFRGADIHAYLAARRDCEGRLYTLGSNYRSSAAMVGAVNHLFLSAETSEEKGAFLFRRDAGGDSIDNPVPFLPVTAGRDPGQWEIDGAPASALTIWFDPDHDKSSAKPDAVARACASEVLRLLQLGQAGRAGFRKDGEFAPLHARDIAILVNNRHEAAGLRAELSRRGIRSVYLSDDGSVYQSPAAHDMLAWLRACAEPENGGYVRAALASAGIGFSWAQLDAFVHDEVLWEAKLEQFADFKELWRRRGVLPMLRRFMHDFGVPARLFQEQSSGKVEGERHLTDLLHLAELLQAVSVQLDGEHAVIRYLEERIAAGDEGMADGDPSRIRLESDAGLVQIVTVHKSKGLEYPLVFYPYAWQARPATFDVPALYRDLDGRPQVLSNVLDIDADGMVDVLTDLEHERLAEDLRKLYVALTRAKHATWMALAPAECLGESAAGYLLGGPSACTSETLAPRLDALAAGCPDIRIAPFPETLEGRLQPAEEQDMRLVWRTMHRHIEQRWHMSSYSALARLAMEEGVLLAPQDGGTQAMPDDARLDAFMEASMVERREAAELSPPATAETEARGIHAFPRGAGPGSFLHGLLEDAFRHGPPRLPDDAAELRERLDRACRGREWEAYADVLSEWLGTFLTQPFHIELPGIGRQRDVVLSGLVTALPEMEFWFGVRDADLQRLDQFIARHFLPGRPRPVMTRGRLNGMLRGFMDLVFEHDGRYYVADYKSNWLGANEDAYHPDALARAVLEHRYELQAAMYLHALHRLLKSRLGDHYDYERHVGGALIFFVRGCRATGQGVHIERPSADVMAQLDSLLNTGEGESQA